MTLEHWSATTQTRRVSAPLLGEQIPRLAWGRVPPRRLPFRRSSAPFAGRKLLSLTQSLSLTSASTPCLGAEPKMFSLTKVHGLSACVVFLVFYCFRFCCSSVQVWAFPWHQVLFKANKNIFGENPLQPGFHADQAERGLGAVLSSRTCVILRHEGLSVKDEVYLTELARLAKRLLFLSSGSGGSSACPCPQQRGPKLAGHLLLSSRSGHALSQGGRLGQPTPPAPSRGPKSPVSAQNPRLRIN